MQPQKIIQLFILNAVFSFLLIVLQFLRFGLLPGMNPNLPRADQISGLKHQNIETASILVVEALFGLTLLYFGNRLVIKKKRYLFVLLTLHLLILAGFATYFFIISPSDGPLK